MVKNKINRRKTDRRENTEERKKIKTSIFFLNIAVCKNAVFPSVRHWFDFQQQMIRWHPLSVGSTCCKLRDNRSFCCCYHPKQQKYYVIFINLLRSKNDIHRVQREVFYGAKLCIVVVRKYFFPCIIRIQNLLFVTRRPEQ